MVPTSTRTCGVATQLPSQAIGYRRNLFPIPTPACCFGPLASIVSSHTTIKSGHLHAWSFGPTTSPHLGPLERTLGQHTQCPTCCSFLFTTRSGSRSVWCSTPY